MQGASSEGGAGLAERGRKKALKKKNHGLGMSV